MAHFRVVDKLLEGLSDFITSPDLVTLNPTRNRSNAELNTPYSQEYHLNLQKLWFYIVQCSS